MPWFHLHCNSVTKDPRHIALPLTHQTISVSMKQCKIRFMLRLGMRSFCTGSFN
jgi:hypothetical protein